MYHTFMEKGLDVENETDQAKNCCKTGQLWY